MVKQIQENGKGEIEKQLKMVKMTVKTAEKQLAVIKGYSHAVEELKKEALAKVLLYNDIELTDSSDCESETSNSSSSSSSTTVSVSGNINVININK